MRAPVRTATTVMGWPLNSAEISLAISVTRFLIVSSSIRVFTKAPIKLEAEIGSDKVESISLRA
jgi:hypothetical protein